MLNVLLTIHMIACVALVIAVIVRAKLPSPAWYTWTFAAAPWSATWTSVTPW